MRSRRIEDITNEYVDAVADSLRDNESLADIRRELRNSGWTIAATATLIQRAEAKLYATR